MITINYIFDDGQWSCDLSIDSSNEMTDELAMKILHTSSISQECMMDVAEKLSEFIDTDKIRKFVTQIIFNAQNSSSKPAEQTVVPTIFSTYDHIRRNDSGS